MRVDHLHAIILVSLNTHIPGPQMLNAASSSFNLDGFFEQHQRFVALRDEPFIGLGWTSCVGSDEQARPERIRLRKVGKLRPSGV